MSEVGDPWDLRSDRGGLYGNGFWKSILRDRKSGTRGVRKYTGWQPMPRMTTVVGLLLRGLSTKAIWEKARVAHRSRAFQRKHLVGGLVHSVKLEGRPLCRPQLGRWTAISPGDGGPRRLCLGCTGSCMGRRIAVGTTVSSGAAGLRLDHYHPIWRGSPRSHGDSEPSSPFGLRRAKEEVEVREYGL